MRTAEHLVLRAKQWHDGIATTQTPAAKEPVRRRV
jgi:hypothetical protein